MVCYHGPIQCHWIYTYRPTRYPQCLLAFTFRWCVSLSGVSVLLQSISLYIWLVRQPMRCICFILLYRPIRSLGMGPHVPIAISVAICRDWLVQCYWAFVHVGAYSVISRL